jgi:hypothetical protein
MSDRAKEKFFAAVSALISTKPLSVSECVADTVYCRRTSREMDDRLAASETKLADMLRASQDAMRARATCSLSARLNLFKSSEVAP